MERGRREGVGWGWETHEGAHSQGSRGYGERIREERGKREKERQAGWTTDKRASSRIVPVRICGEIKNSVDRLNCAGSKIRMSKS